MILLPPDARKDQVLSSGYLARTFWGMSQDHESSPETIRQSSCLGDAYHQN